MVLSARIMARQWTASCVMRHALNEKWKCTTYWEPLRSRLISGFTNSDLGGAKTLDIDDVNKKVAGGSLKCDLTFDRRRKAAKNHEDNH